MGLSIRKGIKEDMAEVLKLIKELAFFEKEPDAVELTEEDLIAHGFGKKPAFESYIAQLDNKIVGVALFYERYSTWKGKAIHLEDLIVQKDHRGKGIGKALYSEVLKFAHSNNFKRVAWEVLDWNTPAIKFYENTGAVVYKEWRVAQIDEKALANFVTNLKHN